MSSSAHSDYLIPALKVVICGSFHRVLGYIGVSASFELGYAHARGLSIFAREEIGEPGLRHLVEVVASPAAAVARAGGER